MRGSAQPRRGSALIEFVLMATFVMLPLVLGLMTVGFALNRSLQVAQLTRDVGRMFVRGVDFSELANQQLITGSASRPNIPALARGLGMAAPTGTATGGTTGNGVLVFSILTRMPANCGCSNAGLIVLVRRIVVGNKTLYTSPYGNPAATLINASTGAVSNYANEITARASSFSSIINLGSSELAYMVESKFIYPDLAMAGVFTNPEVFWRVVF